MSKVSVVVTGGVAAEAVAGVRAGIRSRELRTLAYRMDDFMKVSEGVVG